MCWNHIGSVTLLQGESGVSHSSIDIDFTDSAFRRPISFTDNMGFILGSVGEDGGIFATDLNEDDDDDMDRDDENVVEGLNMSETVKAALKKSQRKRMAKDGKAAGSSIYFNRFDTFANPRDKDWYLTLPDGERALGCACGEGWAAVITSRRFLRLFSSGGNQGQVLWLSGEPVTMVGRGRFLAVFFHESQPLMDGTQKLGCLLLDAVCSRVISKGPVSCISSGSSLSWAGFSNDCSLMTMDSDGMLSMLACTNQDVSSMSWEWMPMLDTVGQRKSADDSFWPVTVYDGKLVCVPLKGGVRHPDATRRPVTTTLGFRLPHARGTLAKKYVTFRLCQFDIRVSTNTRSYAAMSWRSSRFVPIWPSRRKRSFRSSPREKMKNWIKITTSYRLRLTR
jgi:chromosome transmission fidelity protein 4